MSVLKNKNLTLVLSAFAFSLFSLVAQASQEQVKSSETQTDAATQSSVNVSQPASESNAQEGETSDNQKSKADERTAEEKLAQNRRVLNLNPPKAPKSLGGGNGNGGLGSGQITVSSN